MRRLAAIATTVAVIIGGVALAPLASAGAPPTPNGGQPTLAMGDHTTCAVRESGRVYCFGENVSGSLGRGNYTATATVAPSVLSDMIAVYGSQSTNGVGGTMCGLRENGTVACWGRGAGYQLGNGTSSSSNGPVWVDITKVTTMGLGQYNSCAVKQDGTAWCWGAASEIVGGTLRPAPYQIPGVTGATSIAVGSTAACVLKADKSVWCWGLNTSGQLGNSAAGTLSYTPVKVAGLPAATAVAAGTGHMCAITADKTVWCWGTNNNGELGRGYVGTPHATAAPVRRLTGVTYLAIGNATSCVVASGEARCWGSGTGGLLGDGQQNAQPAPVLVEAGIADATMVAVGNDTACEVASKGKVWCWGANGEGEAGTGATTAAHAGGGPGASFGRALEPQSIPILNSAPGKPTGSSKATTKVTISWTAPSTSNGTSAPTDYVIQYRLKGSSAWKTFKDTVSTKTSVTVTGLAKGKYYEFRVQPKNWAGAGKVSAASAYIKVK